LVPRCCFNVVSRDNIQTTLAFGSDIACLLIFCGVLFFRTCWCPDVVSILSPCRLWRQHSNIITIL
jgi:hypothetical protein